METSVSTPSKDGAAMESASSDDDIISLLLSNTLKLVKESSTKGQEGERKRASIRRESSPEMMMKRERCSVSEQMKIRSPKKEKREEYSSSTEPHLFGSMSSSSDIEDIVMERESTEMPIQSPDKETEHVMKLSGSSLKVERAAKQLSSSDDSLLKSMSSFRRRSFSLPFMCSPSCFEGSLRRRLHRQFGHPCVHKAYSLHLQIALPEQQRRRHRVRSSGMIARGVSRSHA